VPKSIEELTDAEWADLARRLTLHAFERLRKTSWEAAQEIAHDAIADLLDPAYAEWDRDKYPDLFDRLGSFVNGRVQNYFRRMRRRGKEVAIVGDVEDRPEIEGGDDPGEVPEQAPLDGEVVVDDWTPYEEPDFVTISEVAMATLRARVANDTMCLGILDLIQGGIGHAGKHAEVLGVPVEDVYTAKRRLLHHARKVAQDLQQRVAS
jgi:hypothetical protein